MTPTWRAFCFGLVQTSQNYYATHRRTLDNELDKAHTDTQSSNSNPLRATQRFASNMPISALDPSASRLRIASSSIDLCIQDWETPKQGDWSPMSFLKVSEVLLQSLPKYYFIYSELLIPQRGSWVPHIGLRIRRNKKHTRGKDGGRWTSSNPRGTLRGFICDRCRCVNRVRLRSPKRSTDEGRRRHGGAWTSEAQTTMHKSYLGHPTSDPRTSAGSQTWTSAELPLQVQNYQGLPDLVHSPDLGSHMVLLQAQSLSLPKRLESRTTTVQRQQ